MCKLPLIKKVRVVIGIVMCFAMTACSQGNQISYPTNNDFSTVYSQKEEVYNQPNESDIAKSLADENIKGLNNTNYKITNVEISKYKIEDRGVHYWCIVTSENDDLKATAELDVLYDYYEKGGWLIENVSDYSNVHYIPKRGVTESQLLANIRARWRNDDYHNIHVLNHNTDIEQGSDLFVFSYTNNFYLYDEIGTVTINYKFDENYGWTLNDKSESDKQYKFHFVESNWYGSTSLSFLCYIKFQPISGEDNRVNICRYSFDNMKMQYSIYRYTYETNIQEDGIIILNRRENGLELNEYGIYGDSVIMYPKERYRETMTQDNDNFKWDNLIERYEFSGKYYERVN